jgi:hypothetical protein
VSEPKNLHEHLNDYPETPERISDGRGPTFAELSELRDGAKRNLDSYARGRADAIAEVIRRHWGGDGWQVKL